MNTSDLGLSDLNIAACSNLAKLKSLVLRALELGYQTVAINTTVDQVFLDSCPRAHSAVPCLLLGFSSKTSDLSLTSCFRRTL